MASAKPATMPDGSAAATSETAQATPEVPIETTTSPGRGVQTERRGRVVAGARPEDRPAGRVAGAPRSARGPAAARRRGRGRARAGRGGSRRSPGTSSRAARVAPVGDQVGERRPCRAAARSASRGGGRRRRCGEPLPARGRASHRSLVDRERRDGHRAHRVGPRRRARRGSAISSSAAWAERVSFHSSASRTTDPDSSRQTMPCCWPPTETAATSSSPPAAADAASNARPPGLGRRPRCRRDGGRGPRGPRPRCRRRRRRPCRTASRSRPRRPAQSHSRGQRTPYRCSRASWSRCSKRHAALRRPRRGRTPRRAGRRWSRRRPASARRAGRRGRPCSACLDLGVGAEGARPSRAGSGSCACSRAAEAQTPSMSSVRGGLKSKCRGPS